MTYFGLWQLGFNEIMGMQSKLLSTAVLVVISARGLRQWAPVSDHALKQWKLNSYVFSLL